MEGSLRILETVKKKKRFQPDIYIVVGNSKAQEQEGEGCLIRREGFVKMLTERMKANCDR